jgi:Holliday junction DNA helicase RuvB
LARESLTRLAIDDLGLDEMDRKMLITVIEKFDGGPVGIESLAAACGEEGHTLEEVYEPFLIQEGFLQRTPRGRIATLRAYKHLGRSQPRGHQTWMDFDESVDDALS